eukprot:Amastigsp_a852772_119.p2 type:complete len:155 gc:universal Amastigsp_a852772_119:787-323(-)
MARNRARATHRPFRLLATSLPRLVAWLLGRLVAWSLGCLVAWSLGRWRAWSLARAAAWSLGRLVVGARPLALERDVLLLHADVESRVQLVEDGIIDGGLDGDRDTGVLDLALQDELCCNRDGVPHGLRHCSHVRGVGAVAEASERARDLALRAL